MIREEIRNRLLELAEDDYKRFNDRLLPGVTDTLGVRVVKLRKLARQLAREDWQSWVLQLEDPCHEERLLWGMVLGYAKLELQQRFEALDAFIPLIDNWAVCDVSCMTYGFMKQEQPLCWEYLERWLDSGREFGVRFSLVCMVGHFINDRYFRQVLNACDRAHCEGYYTQMAAAWAVSACYVKYPEPTAEFLQCDQMDTLTHNKAIQKICESYQVPKEQKVLLRAWKRS